VIIVFSSGLFILFAITSLKCSDLISCQNGLLTRVTIIIEIALAAINFSGIMLYIARIAIDATEIINNIIIAFAELKSPNFVCIEFIPKSISAVKSSKSFEFEIINISILKKIRNGILTSAKTIEWIDKNGINPYKIVPVTDDPQKYFFRFTLGWLYKKPIITNNTAKIKKVTENISELIRKISRIVFENTFTSFTEIFPLGIGRNGLLILSSSASKTMFEVLNQIAARDRRIRIGAMAIVGNVPTVIRYAAIGEIKVIIKYWGVASSISVCSFACISKIIPF